MYIVQPKSKIIKQTSQGVSDGMYQMVFVLKCCISRNQNLSGNNGSWGL